MKKTATAIVKKLDDAQTDRLIQHLSVEYPEHAVPEVLKKLKEMKKEANELKKETAKKPKAEPDKTEPLNPDNSDNEDEKAWLLDDKGEKVDDPIHDTE